MRSFLIGLTLAGLLAGCGGNKSLIQQQEAQITFLTQENQQIQERLNAAANRAAELEIELDALRAQGPSAPGDPDRQLREATLQTQILELETELARVEEALETARRRSDPPTARASSVSPSPSVEQVLHVEVLPTDAYYIEDSARLKPTAVQRLAPILRRLKDRYPTQRIRVEGYTDNAVLPAGVKERFPSNWELSAARAAMLVRHMQWTHQMDPTRFEVVGYGHYRSFASNATEAGRQQNRVVRILVLAD